MKKFILLVLLLISIVQQSSEAIFLKPYFVPLPKWAYDRYEKLFLWQYYALISPVKPSIIEDDLTGTGKCSIAFQVSNRKGSLGIIIMNQDTSD